MIQKYFILNQSTILFQFFKTLFEWHGKEKQCNWLIALQLGTWEKLNKKEHIFQIHFHFYKVQFRNISIFVNPTL